MERGERRAAVYRFVGRYVDRCGYAPTLREIAAGVGLATPSAALHHLYQLEEMGLIERRFHAARAIRLVFRAGADGPEIE